VVIVASLALLARDIYRDAPGDQEKTRVFFVSEQELGGAMGAIRIRLKLSQIVLGGVRGRRIPGTCGPWLITASTCLSSFALRGGSSLRVIGGFGTRTR
jgi:hypothetical protein